MTGKSGTTGATSGPGVPGTAEAVGPADHGGAGGTTVLVTGGSGFLATRCIAQALERGHRVRTTVRDPAREADVRKDLAAAGVAAGEALSFVVADLTSDDGWTEAVDGCAYVLHVASPFPPSRPRDENELIVPAREGTLRVLRAARDARVRRVVVTSSFAAVGYGHPETDRPFTEDDWTDVDGGVSPYIKSKTLAERAAWDFMAREGGGTELSVVNPVGIFGPVLGPDHAESINMVRMLLDGDLPGVPRLHFGVVDVRDAADLHLRAMTSPRAAGRRFVASAGDAVSLHDIALTLRGRLGEAARRVPVGVLPDEAVRKAAETDPAMRETADNLGRVRHLTSERARRLLGWRPRSGEDAVTATAESLIRLGLTR
ncbi:SDR family oxidoreductase [Streptomyces fructofermentans]|uniref:Dihydroflavonol-4-reductase n=1 Tax=Streptomyces fructofermentans TaxID=152141 RepID=A0A918KCV6_9ACTN|nr:aldehyde reductase [Streptomyces fructofermentans]GGX57461.1 dihydroflavonol-4-reductase [Streptomyces fructofermentans]